MDPDAKKVLADFQSALAASDWSRVLSLCTQTVMLFDGFGLASQYRIIRPGTYTVQFSGRGLSVGDREEDDSTEHGEDHPSFSLSGTCASNTVQIEVLRAGR
jgi:hypothetical protein